VLAACVVLAVLLALVVGLLWGTENTSVGRALGDPDSLDRLILLRVRLPRVLLAIVAGGALAGSGVALQSVLRNPLAEPYILGVSGGAALGATLALLFGLGTVAWLGAMLLPACALVGGLLATFAVIAIARRGHGRGAELLLAGVVLNAIAAGAITFIKTVVSAAKAQELLFWLTGFLDVPSTTSLVVLSVYVSLGLLLLAYDAPRLNLLALGDESAASLGVDVPKLTLRVLIACSLLTGAVVSMTGLIGFVGLVVPHALRRVMGPDVRRLLPLSVAFGGVLLVLCDTASRSLFRVFHTEPPVGAITALVGGPVFLVLLHRRRRD
jgi:iron complex transport system permease protein